MIFWTENDILKEKAALKKSAILYAAVAAGYLIVSVTLLLTSKGREYFWFMAGDIALSVAFAWGSFWFFTNPFAERKSLIALYGKMTVSEEYVETGVLTDISEITKDGLLMRTLTLDCEGSVRTVNALLRQNDFEKGATYSFNVRAGVVVSGDKK